MTLNRKQKRDIKKVLKKESCQEEKINAFFNKIENNKSNPNMAYEGELVKIDYAAIVLSKDWGILNKKYKNWLKENQDKIFTVEYDKNRGENFKKEKHILVQLKEDTTNPKWLFWAGYLIPEKGQDLKKLEEKEKNNNIKEKNKDIINEAILREVNQIV